MPRVGARSRPSPWLHRGRLWGWLLLWASSAWGQWGAPTNLRNAPFEAATAGWPGVTVLEVQNPHDPQEVARKLGAFYRHRAPAEERLPAWFRFLQRHGVLHPRSRPWFLRTVVLRSRGELVLPNLQRLRQGGPPPGQGGELTLVLDDSWSGPQKQSLQDFLKRIQPILTNLYGPPAFPNRVTILHDPTLRGWDMGVYDVSRKEIRLRLLQDDPDGVPQLTPIDPHDFYVLTGALLRAYHDELRLAYDAWEEGFQRAAQLVAIRQYDPNFDVLFSDPGYVLPTYEPLNQPTLSGPVFEPVNTSPLLRQVRAGMAQAAWYKVYAENHDFFKEFNARYYAQYLPNESPPLAGDTVRLRAIARSVVPEVEGLPFDDWFRRQFIFDTSLKVGPKLYTFFLPDQRTAILIIYYFITLADGSEAALTGTVRLRYLAWDGFDISHVPEEGNEVEIGHFGDPGIANIAPTFYNIGGPQRILIEVNIQGHQTLIYYPYFVRNQEPENEMSPPHSLFGVVSEGDEGTLTIEVEGLEPKEVKVKQGVFWADVPGGMLTSNRIGFRFQPKETGAPASVGRRNTGLDYYVPLLTTFLQPLQVIARTFAAGTQMVGFPLRPARDYEPSLLGLEPGRVLLARWEPEVNGGTYRFFPDTPPPQPGLGYWLRTTAPLNLSVQGRPVPTEEDFRLRLPFGWNQIANPFLNFPVALADVKVQWGEEGPLPWEQAMQEGWVAGVVWEYDPTEGYRPATRLEPWKGYWLRVYVLEGVTLFIPPKAASGRGTREREEPAAGWRVQLIAEAGGRRDAWNFFGVMPGASRGWDVWDWPQPPEPEGFVSLCFPQGQWGERNGLYASDIRPPGQRWVWTVEVMTDRPQEPVHLRWEGLRSVPKEVALFLEDEETGQRWDLRQVAGITLSPQQTSYPHRFRLWAEPRALQPLAILGLRALPLRSGNGQVGIRCETTASARLWVAIRQAGGHLVRELVRGEPRAAGGQQWLWDRRDVQGRLVPAGVYLVEVRAQDETGREVRALATVNLF